MDKQHDRASKPKVFIVGTPRSGTSILYMAIKEVFDYPGPIRESHVIPVFRRMLSAWDAYAAVYRPVKDDILFKTLSKDSVVHSLSEFVRAFYRQEFGDSWIDKTPTPEAPDSLDFIEATFPDAKLIATTRSGIEVISSHMKKFENANFVGACNGWTHAMRSIASMQLRCKNLLVVEQFDFQNDTGAVSARICEHLGAPSKTAALADYFRNRRVEQSSSHDWSRRLTLADVNWTEEERALFIKHCGAMMQERGYPL